MTACKDCKAREQMWRDALLQLKIGEALGHTVKGVAEAVGLKPKTGAAELVYKSTAKKAKGVKK